MLSICVGMVFVLRMHCIYIIYELYGFSCLENLLMRMFCKPQPQTAPYFKKVAPSWIIYAYFL